MATHSARVVCLDTVMIDFALNIDELPKRGGDSLASRRLVTAGGGYNLMSAARRQGVDTTYVGQLGRGRFAELARATLLDEGIEVALASRGEGDLGVCVVLVDAGGERSFVTSPGAELTLSAQDLASVSLVSGDVVYLSGYNVVYPEVAGVVAGWLSELGREVVVAFDPGPRGADINPDIVRAVLERTNWLLCNEVESRLMSGAQGAGNCARALRERWGFELVVVRDGAAGCVSDGEEGLLRSPGFSTIVVDTNGAGDVHNGVFIAETLRGSTREEATQRANAAAAIAISLFGPATCPTRESIDALLKSEPQQVTRL